LSRGLENISLRWNQELPARIEGSMHPKQPARHALLVTFTLLILMVTFGEFSSSTIADNPRVPFGLCAA
jgi:hypothetical protein